MADRLRHCQLSSPVSVINISWSSAMLITPTVEICIQQLGQVEEIVWLPYDVGLSAAAETLVGMLKRVIVTRAVYLRFFEFLHVDIQSTGHTLLRPWSRQPNDVMSEIECAQLHSELLGRRHSRRQSHVFFALSKHLSSLAANGFVSLCSLLTWSSLSMIAFFHSRKTLTFVWLCMCTAYLWNWFFDSSVAVAIGIKILVTQINCLIWCYLSIPEVQRVAQTIQVSMAFCMILSCTIGCRWLSFSFHVLFSIFFLSVLVL